MIVRRWHATIRSEDEKAYIDYIMATGASAYRETPGNLGFQVLSRDLGRGVTEVVTLSWWRDLAAIKAFAGDDYEQSKYYADDDRFLLTKTDRVEHYDVAISNMQLPENS
jgi:heme-degrading monooxygenase HmoA